VIYIFLLAALYFELKANKLQLIILVLSVTLAVLISYLVDSSPNIPVSLAPLLFTLMIKRQALTLNKMLLISLTLMFLLNLSDKFDLLDDIAGLYDNIWVTSFLFKIDHFGMVIIAITMLSTSIKNILQRSEALQSAKYQIEKLEYQFLQKHIQPHFLMNTLMSLQQLIRTRPNIAIDAIDDLAEEFKLLNEMSKKSLVAISQEIRICQIHLNLMSLQQQTKYSLAIEGVNYDELIPPAILHTLIENGLTHGYIGNEEANFKLTKTVNNHWVSYTVTNDGKSSTSSTSSTGTGLKYIESRLQEWAPNNWHLTSQAIESGWETMISIRAH
jgi:hypothetical protein